MLQSKKSNLGGRFDQRRHKIRPIIISNGYYTSNRDSKMSCKVYVKNKNKLCQYSMGPSLLLNSASTHLGIEIIKLLNDFLRYSVLLAYLCCCLFICSSGWVITVVVDGSGNKIHPIHLGKKCYHFNWNFT